MADGGEEGALLRQSAAIRDNAEGVHLQAVVVVEAEGLVLYDARVELKAGGLQALARTRMAAIEDRHIVLLRHLVDGIEQRQEVLLRIDVLFAVSAQKDILPLLQPQPSMNVRSFNLCQVVVQHLRHWRSGHVGAFLRKTGIGQIATGMLRVRHIHIGNNIHDATVSLFRQAFILATVAGFHVEDGNVQPLRADDAKARVGVPQHQHRIGLDFHHQLVGLRDDITHGLAQIGPHRIHIHVRVRELQVLEEHAVQIVVIVLSGVRQKTVKILAAFVDNRRQTNDFRAGADDNQKLQLPVILKTCHIDC